MSDNNGLPAGKHTLIEEGTELKGAVTSSCPIVVLGKIEGDVTGPMIHVASSGVVAGNVKVKELRSQGELAGSVEAEIVQIAGTVRDATVIRARALQVSLNHDKGMEVVFGECELAIGDEPDKAAAIAAALGPVEPAKPVALDVVASAAEITPPVDSAPDDDRAKRRQSGTQPPPLS